MHLFRNPGPGSAFDPGAFFGREEALSALMRACLDGGRGIGASVMLHGPPEAGKTSLLLKLESALSAMPEAMTPRPFPFYFAFSKIHTSPIPLSEQFLREYLGRLLAFVKPDSPPASTPDEACERLDGLGFPFCREVVDGHRRHVASGDGLSALVNALTAPFSAPISSVYPVFLLDDFQFASKINDVPDGAVLSILRPFIKSGRFPIVLSGSTPGRITAGLKREGLYGTFRMIETAGLSSEAAGLMWDYLCARRNLSAPAAVRERAVERLGGVPAYLRMFAEELSFAGATIPDEIAFENLYAWSVTEGGLNRYWKALFESALPDRGLRGRAIRFLKRVLCDRFPLDSVEGAITLYGGDVIEGETVLEALEMKGLLRSELDHIEFHRDPVLEDFLVWGVERGAMGRTSSQVASGIVQLRLSRAATMVPEGERESIRNTVKMLMRRWDCREVPALLFDFGRFRSRFGGKGLLEIMVGLEEEPAGIRLPKISAVSRGYRADGGGSRFDFDLVGYGFENADYSESRMVAWAVDIDPGKTLTRASVEHFENRCRLLALEKALPPERLSKWILFCEAADPAAIELAATVGIHLTHRSQLRLFLNRFGMDEGAPTAASPPPVHDGTVERAFGVVGETASAAAAATPAVVSQDAATAPDSLEFTLDLPVKADTEVVAARLAEEIANWASLDADSVDRLKMAIIEACINAFEHGAPESGRVRLRYVLSPGKIEILVSDDGRGFRAGDAPASGGNRGWGIKLMRELVDEVEIESGAGGTVVRLVKYVDPVSAAAAGTVDAG